MRSITLLLILLSVFLNATKSTMKPYKINGVTYRPYKVKIGYKQYGIASWYGKDFHTKKTSNGERYNMYAYTAAHKEFPIGTMVRVTNIKSRKSVVVRINDRGPFVAKRVIDCSYVAGKVLGLDKLGIAKVKLEVVGLEGKIAKKSPLKKVRQVKKIKEYKRKKRVAKAYKKHPIYYVNKGKYFLQVGSFYNLENANRCKVEYGKKYGLHRITQQRFTDVTSRAFYRIFIIGFHSKEEIEAFQKRYGITDAIVIEV